MQPLLADITEHGALRVAGAGAAAFVSVMFAGDVTPLDEVMGLSQGVFLNGEGQVIDLANVLRTGEGEFLVSGSAANRAELFEWLSAYAAIEDDEGRVFEGVEVEDVSDLLGVLVMAGEGCVEAHDELVAACEGAVTLLDYRFDEPAYGIPAVPAFLMFAPLSAAPAIGEFLQGYPQLYPVGSEEFARICTDAGHWIPELEEGAYLEVRDDRMRPWAREGGRFVGAGHLNG